jgi:Flp pilus assembly secretin CpaC
MRRPIQTLVLAAVALCASAAAAAAAGSMTVELNESRRITLPGPAANVIVGNTNVADVAMVDAHSVIVLGRGYGSTQLLITDHAGHTLLDSDVSVVSPDTGRVTLYRGAAASEYACAGRRCHALPKTAGDTSSDASAAAAAQPHP